MPNTSNTVLAHANNQSGAVVRNTRTNLYSVWLMSQKIISKDTSAAEGAADGGIEGRRGTYLK